MHAQLFTCCLCCCIIRVVILHWRLINVEQFNNPTEKNFAIIMLLNLLFMFIVMSFTLGIALMSILDTLVPQPRAQYKPLDGACAPDFQQCKLEQAYVEPPNVEYIVDFNEFSFSCLLVCCFHLRDDLEHAVNLQFASQSRYQKCSAVSPEALTSCVTVV
jgi:hypothetical protein